MMDFLIICGIKKDTVKKIMQNPSNAFDLEANKDECIKIILYLKLIGITNLDSLILYRQHIFLKTKEEITRLFEGRDVKTLVLKINDDYENIDLLFE